MGKEISLEGLRRTRDTIFKYLEKETQRSLAFKDRAEKAEAQRDRLIEAVESDLLEYVHGSHERPEALSDPEAAYKVGVPMACAAVELYRNRLRAALAELEKNDE